MVMVQTPQAIVRRIRPPRSGKATYHVLGPGHAHRLAGPTLGAKRDVIARFDGGERLGIAVEQLPERRLRLMKVLLTLKDNNIEIRRVDGGI
jgi:hypothetical protein